MFVSSFGTWRLKNLDELIEVRKVTTDLGQEVTVGWDDPESVFRKYWSIYGWNDVWALF